MDRKFNAACLQLHTGEDLIDNLQKIRSLTDLACDQGADFVFLPEHAPYIIRGDLRCAREIALAGQDPALDFFKDLAKEKNIWLCATMGVLDQKTAYLLNRTYLFRSDGQIAAFYDKIHLFNAKLGGEENHSESSIYHAGNRIVTATTPWGKIGFAICYDLRFPDLFQQLREEGADFFCIPSSFSYLTGKAHWHALLRARAIENSCFVIAPNQFGRQKSGLIAYGHSLIVSPWGEVVQDGGEGVGVILSPISTKEIMKARTLLPVPS